uniref:Mammalian defensins domain-containing protein n=1 Tax=Sciurus vulgaris TaxID=55149 RepID=A0A8D2CMI7_SCIVU
MRTLTLLTALLLLALQGQAQPLPGNAEEAPDQEQSGKENQDVEISFAGPLASALQKAVSPILRKAFFCPCRSRSCRFLGPTQGICTKGTRLYMFCCL